MKTLQKRDRHFSSIGGAAFKIDWKYKQISNWTNRHWDSGVQVTNADFKHINACNYVDKVYSKVGVNQSSPSYDLDVTGDGRFTGKIYFANMFSQTSDLPSATTYHGHVCSALWPYNWKGLLRPWS